MYKFDDLLYDTKDSSIFSLQILSNNSNYNQSKFNELTTSNLWIFQVLLNNKYWHTIPNVQNMISNTIAKTITKNQKINISTTIYPIPLNQHEKQEMPRYHMFVYLLCQIIQISLSFVGVGQSFFISRERESRTYNLSIQCGLNN